MKFNQNKYGMKPYREWITEFNCGSEGTNSKVQNVNFVLEDKQNNNLQNKKEKTNFLKKIIKKLMKK